MNARIAGLGQWLPPTVRDNAAWPAEFVSRGQRSERRELVDVTAEFGPQDPNAAKYFEAEAGDPFLGATRRRVADARMTAPEAEAEAGRAALADAGLDAREVDLVVSWAAVPERIVPPSAPAVAHLLGAERAWAVGMDAACSTPLAQLEFAAAMVETGRARHVLLTQSHLITRAFPLLHPASPNVGDAATAFVVSVSERPSLLASFARTHGEYYSAVTWCRAKDAEAPWWEEGPAYYLGSKAREQALALVQATVTFGTRTVREALSLANLPLEAVDVLASVQPRRWVPGAIAEALGGRMAAPNTFDELAHLGGCGVITNLIAGRELGLVKPGSHVVLYAQGAGFTRAAAVIAW